MTYPRKVEIATAILSKLDSVDNKWHGRDIEKVIFDWFVTGRQGEGLRLTDSGKLAFEIAEIPHFDIDLNLKKGNFQNSSMYQKFLLQMNNKLSTPYYIGTKQIDGKIKPYIRLYDGKIAMMLTLHGDIYSYLDSL